MVRFLELLVALIIVAVLFVVVGVFLPSHSHVSKSMEINRKPQLIYDAMNNFMRFPAWSTISQRDNTTKYNLSGARSGQGAKVSYNSSLASVGEGTWTITESVPTEKIAWDIDDNDTGFNKKSVLTISDGQGDNKKVTWTYDVDFGWNLIDRYKGLYVGSHRGDAIDVGLKSLKNTLLSVADMDYSNNPIDRVVVKPQNMLTKRYDVKKDYRVTKESFLEAVPLLAETAKKNNMKVVGMPRLTTISFGNTYKFDVGLPVAPLAEGETFSDEWLQDGAMSKLVDEQVANGADKEVLLASATKRFDESADGDIAWSLSEPVDAPRPAAPVPTTVDPESVELPEGVEFKVSYGGPALRMPFNGHAASVPGYHENIRAFAGANGFKVTEQAFDRYIYGSENVDEAQRTYLIYWPIK